MQVTRKNGALTRSNTSEAVADIAREAIARRPDAVRALLEEDVSRHFWTPSDLDRMCRKWTTRA